MRKKAVPRKKVKSKRVGKKKKERETLHLTPTVAEQGPFLDLDTPTKREYQPPIPAPPELSPWSCHSRFPKKKKIRT